METSVTENDVRTIPRDVPTSAQQQEHPDSITDSTQEPIHALDKYSNLQGEIEQVRREVSLRRSDLSACQTELHELQVRHDTMVEAIHQARLDEMSWRDQSARLHQDLQEMKQVYTTAQNRRGCAEKVRSMNHRRSTDARRTMEESMRNFHDSCHRLLYTSHGAVLSRKEEDRVVVGSGHDGMMASMDASTKNASQIHQTDWFLVLSRVWSEHSEAEKRDDDEKRPDDETPQENVRTPTTQEGEMDVQTSTGGVASEECEQPRWNAEDTDTASSTKMVTDKDCDSLFQEFMKRVRTADAVRDAKIAKAEAKLSKAQSHHHQMLQTRDQVQEEHERWSTKVHRQRDNCTNIANQLARIQKDIRDLQEQLDHAHAQNALMQKKMAAVGSIGGSSNNDDRRDSTRKRPCSAVSVEPPAPPPVAHAFATRNPYAKPKAIREANPNASDRNAGSGANQLPASHVVISPGAESRALCRNSGEGDNIRFPHRLGRIRGARGFGVSLSLQDVSASLQRTPYQQQCPSLRGDINKTTTTPRTSLKYSNTHGVEMLEEESEFSDAENSAKGAWSTTPRRSKKNDSSSGPSCDLPIVSTAKKTKARTAAVFADDSSDDVESEDLEFAFRK